MREFYLYREDATFPDEATSALEEAMKGFIPTDVPLAVELLFVPAEEIRALNNETRGIDKVTDVLSYPTLENIKGKALQKQEFPFDIDEEGNLLIGSIVICLERAKEQAIEYGHSFERELHYLIVHGIMHCLGYDHVTDADKAEMREKEEQILTKLKITR